MVFKVLGLKFLTSLVAMVVVLIMNNLVGHLKHVLGWIEANLDTNH